jgi:hypothetical protein
MLRIPTLLTMTAVLCGGMLRAGLPDPAPAFEPQAVARQKFNLVVDKKVKDRNGKTGLVPALVSGTKRFCFNTHMGQPRFGKPASFSIYIPDISKKHPALTINLGGYIPGVGGGQPFKGTDDSKGVISVDEAGGTVLFTKEYYYAADKTATFVCKIGNADPGQLKLEWTTGLTDAQIQTLPKGSEFIVNFQSVPNQYKELGLSVDGRTPPLVSAEELRAGKKLKTWCNKNLGNSKGASLTLFGKSPQSTIAWTIPSSFNIHMYESMWNDPKTADLITFNARASCPLNPSGSITIDLGKTGLKAADAPPPVANVDFYARDRMHLPMLPTRNLLPNPSFEQDLRYLRWYWGGGSGGLSPIPTYTTCDDAKFGSKSLKLQPSPRGDYALASFPIPMLPGQTYTLSFYAKSSEPSKLLSLKILNALTNYESKFRHSSQPDYRLSTEWERYSFTFEADTRAMVILINKRCRGPLFVDAMQLELGDKATAFVSPAVEGILKTSDPDNMIDKGSKIDASLVLSGQSGTRGTVRIRVKDFYDKVLFDNAYEFKLDAAGAAAVKLPFDTQDFGSGVFVVRADYSVSGQADYTDYYRYSEMEFLENTHASKNMFNNQFVPRLTRREDLARNYKRWGIGSICAVTNTNMIDIKHQLCEQNNIDFSFGSLFDMANSDKKYRDNSHALMRRNPWGRTVEHWNDITPERAKWVEEVTYELVKQYPFITTWAPMGETECRMKELHKGDFSQWAKMAKAFHKGAKRANPNIKLLGCQGPAGFVPELNRGIEEVKGVMRSVQGEIKWDAIATHPYFSTDGVNGASDLDTNIAYLKNLMTQHGYGDSPIWFPEGGNFTSMRIPEWNSVSSQDQYVAGRASYDSGWGEYRQAYLHARRFIIAFKYWPQVRHNNMWTARPFVDYYLSPLYMCKVVNTLGQVFANPTYVADIKPMKSVRGYAFTDHEDRGLVAIWATVDKVDNGLERGPEMLVRFPGELPEFIDLMGNKREVKADKGTVKVLLSSAPLFIRSQKGGVRELIAALRDAEIVGARNVMDVNVLPNASGAIEAIVTNKVGRTLAGTVSTAEHTAAFEVAESGRTVVPVSKPRAPKTGILHAWTNTLEAKLGQSDSFTSNWDLSYFYVPRVRKPLPLDPDADEWKAIPAFEIDNWRVTDYNKKHNIPSGYKGDMSASYQLAWDKDSLYLRVSIKDDKHAATPSFNPTALYDFDNSIEVYLDTAANARAGGSEKGYDQDDYRYDFAPVTLDGNRTSGRAQVYRLREVYHQLAGGIEMPGKKDVAQNLQSRFKRTPDGCVYVVRFEQRYLEPFMLKKGSTGGFALYVHDKEPGEKSPCKGLSASTKPGQHCDYYPRYWPIMVLGEE